jgi:hypothetical protein
MNRAFRLAGCVALGLGLGAAGCSSGGPESPSATSSAEFVAFAGNFTGFHTWPSTPGVGPPGAPDPSAVTDGGIHAGTLTTYINQMPPAGSTSFPQGTIIVKEQDQPPLASRQTFAMVKRGGGYDSAGAVGWEWFELQDAADGTASIIWRGVGPPGGMETYGGNPEVCNTCHAGAQNNDFVWTAGLALSAH